MALINIESFKALYPIAESENLLAEYASDLLDCDLKRGSLAPVNDDLLLSIPVQDDTEDFLFRTIPSPESTPTLVNHLDCDISVPGTVTTTDSYGSAYSSTAFTAGSAILVFQVGQTHTNIYVGLDQDPSASSDANTIDFAFYLRPGGGGEGTVDLIHNSTPLDIGDPIYTANTVFKIIYDGSAGIVKYYMDTGEGFDLKYTKESVADNLVFYFDSGLYGSGVSITNISFVALEDSDGIYEWDTPVDIAKNLDSITSERILISGDGYPKEADVALGSTGAGPWPAATRRNGLPAPDTAPGLSIGGSGTEVQGEYSWVYTYYFTRPDGTVIESAPSPPTAVITVDVGETVTLTTMAYPSPAVDGCSYTGVRIYRLYSTEISSLYHFVREQTNVNNWLDNVSDAQASANAVLETMDMSTGFPVSWDVPIDTLKGVILTDFGFFVGYSGNEVYLSVIFVSYAFPGKYSLSTDSEIVGLGYTGSIVVVLTKANPHILSGQNPASVSIRRLNYVRPCIGESRSIISTPAGVIFPSKEGMSMIDNTGTETLITENIFTAEQWEALNPETFTSFLFQGRLVCFEVGTKNVHIIDYRKGVYEKGQALRIVRGALHEEADQLIYIITDDASTGRELRVWRGGTAKDYSWQSKVFDLIPKTSISRGNIKGDFSGGKTASLTMVKDGVDMSPITITGEGLVNLGRKLSNNVSIKLSGQAKIKKIYLGRSASEALNV
ncbi:MAG: hypothetical protein DRH26_03660 [Deltaproteobacteria bacterium]|nr:MAG: hypothetical protein DRH26_03660 [Deltaproteobacteria bacterium]